MGNYDPGNCINVVCCSVFERKHGKSTVWRRQCKDFLGLCDVIWRRNMCTWRVTQDFLPYRAIHVIEFVCHMTRPHLYIMCTEQPSLPLIKTGHLQKTDSHFLRPGKRCVYVMYQLLATQADRFWLETLQAAYNSLKLPPEETLESARRKLGRSGNHGW